MKWILVPITVFLGAFVLFVAMPDPILIQARDVMERSLDSLTAVFRPGMNRAMERTEPSVDEVRDRVESQRPETPRADMPDIAHRPGMNQAMERVEPSVDERRARVQSQRSETLRADVWGIARVLDGDTIEIGTAKIRLWGVDAPESRQNCLAGNRHWPCGQRATQALASLIDGRSVACEERDHDGRVIAVCRHGGRVVNSWLVRHGWALAYRRYSKAYVDEELAAKAGKRGLWRGEFVRPWDWRRGKRLRTPNRDAQHASTRDRGACNIKGNISRNSGKRIYHVPGDPDYANTRISTSHGERWFCTESEARAAGWRRASTRSRGTCNIKGNISRNSGRRIYHVPGDPDYASTRISTSHGERWFCTQSEARAAGWRRAGQ